ncbi:hypothetical protein CVT25_010016 [Psilocybe cyanescens]|uniref:F-box domain-containing protein n=1 Tax=Psilocybe cyanescens TaxID=93625 RepID=A0A409X3A5_PSICY|nr:hypothetical protein CVT25_010016 [Psilocybe cyanescens]
MTMTMGYTDSNKIEESLMLVYLPPEILLIILTLVDPSDILSLRQTCRTLHKLTHERVVWLSKLQEQETHLPLPPEILHNREEDGHLFTYSVAAIESTVIKAQHTAEAWTRARVRTPKKLKKGSDGSTLIGLKLLLDRWLVAVYYEGVVHIYDTQPQASFTTGSRHTNPTNLDSHDAAVLRASLVLETNSYTSFSVAIDSTGHRLILALSHPRPPHKIDIYQIELLDLSGETPTLNKVFYLIRSIPLPHYKVIQALDVANRVIIISTPGIVDVLKWDEDYNTEVLGRRGAIFRVNIEDIEGLWNGVVAVRLFGSYILVHKTRSIEIHRYKNYKPNEPPGHVLKHVFSLTFREVSLSECSKSTNKISETTTYEISTFAYDVIQGLFQYTIRLTIPQPPTSELLPSFDVQLAGVYPLALGVVQPIASSRSAPQNQSPPTPMTYSPNFSPSPSFSHTHATRNLDASSFAGSRRDLDHSSATTTDYSSRGFLSTHCIGPQGKRGIWVERKRTSTVRDLQIWSRESPFSTSAADSSSGCMLSGPGDGGFPLQVVEMERRVVYTLHSYDLRGMSLISFSEMVTILRHGHRVDDIICSTFGELSGTIVLGHRSGDISIIKLEH